MHEPGDPDNLKNSYSSPSTMTFFHFGNCVALAYVPYLITYKFSGLSEYSTFYKCVYAGKIMEFFKGTIGKEFRLVCFFILKVWFLSQVALISSRN